MSFETIQLNNPSDYVLQLVLNRPRQLNALNRVMIQELHQAMDTFDASSHEFLLLTGSGRAFCFGADFQEFQNREALRDLLASFQQLILKIHHSPKITISVLNGFATGAGLDLALACDFRIAAERTKLGEAYITMGLVPDGGGTYFLPRLIGVGRALQMLLTGEAITVEEALSIGMIHRVVPHAQLAQIALQFATELSRKPKTARKLIKQLVRQPTATLEEGLRREAEAQLHCFDDSEHRRLAEEYLKKRTKQD